MRMTQNKRVVFYLCFYVHVYATFFFAFPTASPWRYRPPHHGIRICPPLTAKNEGSLPLGWGYSCFLWVAQARVLPGVERFRQRLRANKPSPKTRVYGAETLLVGMWTIASYDAKERTHYSAEKQPLAAEDTHRTACPASGRPSVQVCLRSPCYFPLSGS